MAQEKTNHLKIQFHICTIYILWSPLMSLLIHHIGLHLLPWGQQCRTAAGSSTSTLHAPAAVLVALPQSAHLSGTKLGWCIPLASLPASPLVSEKSHASVIHDWCSRSAQGRYQILIVLGAVQTRGARSSAIMFPTYSACSTFSSTFPSLLRQDILKHLLLPSLEGSSPSLALRAFHSLRAKSEDAAPREATWPLEELTACFCCSFPEPGTGT